jgi:uncharacterized protein
MTALFPGSVPAVVRLFSIIILLSSMALVTGLFQGSACAQNLLAKPSGCVHDFADLMTPPYEKRIGNISKELNDKTGVALFVVTVHDFAGLNANQYAERLYSEWNIGKNEADKGVLILVSMTERKLRIRTGSGLKATLTPRQIGEVQDRFVAPLLKQNNYNDGLLNGVSAIAKIIAKEKGVALKTL